MMKGYDNMKLGDCIFEYSQRNKEDKNYPVYSVTNTLGFCQEYFSKDVSGKDKTTYKLVPRGYFAYNPSRINVGSVDWQKSENCVIVSPLYVVFGLKDTLKPEYLKYYLKSKPINELIRLSTSGTVRDNLKYSTLEKFPIPVPSIKKQEEICSLLDKLSLVIEKKKQQVKELDNLAQAIFYDMFGDVNTNNHSYDIQTLSSVCEILTDGTHQTPEYTQDIVNGVKFLSAKDVVGGVINWNNIKYIPQSLHESLYSRLAPKRNDILLCKNGTTGIAAVVETDEIFDIYVSLALLRLKDGYLPKYILYAINNPTTKQQFDDSLKGVGVPNLHLGEIKKTRIVVPPLSLQQSFAQKVESIERQKELINQSIREAQTLFDSRMEYYFGE